MINKLLVVLLLAISVPAIAVNNKNTEPPKSEQAAVFHKVENWYKANMNYTNITLLMTIESSFIPFPSEIVIPPASYIASKGDSNLNIFLIVLFGTLGSLIGALINYFLAMWLGRPLLFKIADSKIGKLLLLSSAKIRKSEDYFQSHGKTSTFVGRLIPGIRQLISLPAGLAKMNLPTFILYTVLGAGVWNSVLAFLGYLTQGQEGLIDKYSHEIGYALTAIVALVALFYVFKFLRKKSKK